MLYLSCLILITIQSLLFLTVPAAIQKASNFEARNIVLYNSTSVSMPNTIYIINLNSSFTGIPTLAFGINNYRLGDRFAYQNFQSAPSVVNTNSFSISVTSTGTTNVRIFSISYAVSGISAISSQYQALTNLTLSTLSSGSGDRYIQVYFSKSFTSTNVLALPFITGFYITSNTYFQYIITAQVISNFNYRVTFNTTSDCLLLSLSFYVLFCQTNKLPAQSYYLGGQDLFSSTNVNSASYTATVTNYGNADFILGLRGFEGFTVLSGCYWGWQIASVNSTSATLTIDKNQLQKISFSFFQLGQESTTDDPESTGSQSSSGSMGIIVGLIIGIIVVAVGIILFLRYYWRRGVYNIPKNDNFKEMPSLTL